MTIVHQNISDDQDVIAAGYKPLLRRSVGYLSSFSVSFSFMSVLMGVFATYGFALGKAGPFGIWTWLLIAVGQFFVGLVFAEMSARVPLTGAIYNWNSRLISPFAGWLTAWMLIFGYSVGNVGIIAAMMTTLQSIAGTQFSAPVIYMIGTGAILVQLFINLYGVQFAAYCNRTAVLIELVALVIFSVTLLVVMFVKNEAHVELITTIPQSPVPYWQGFLMASLMAIWVHVGFETPSDLSEETVNVRVVTPKSILSSLVTTSILGFVFLLAITLAIKDVASVTAASDPLSVIIASHFGETATRIMLMLVVLCMFAGTMVGMTVMSRVFYAVARDRQIIGASFFTKISSHGVPTRATLLIAVFEIVIFLLAKDAVDLFGASNIVATTVYSITVCGFAFRSKKLPAHVGFSLGRWHWPVVTVAIIWLVGELLILTLPNEFHTSTEIAGGIGLAGLLIYLVGKSRNLAAKVGLAIH